MEGLKKVNAILLAGDRRASVQVHDDNKAFLPLRGDPLLIHILRALKQSRFVQDILVIGPSDRLSEMLKNHAAQLMGDGKILVIEQRDNMIDNFKVAYVAALGLPETVSFAELREPNHKKTSAGSPRSRISATKRRSTHCRAGAETPPFHCRAGAKTPPSKEQLAAWADTPALVVPCDIPLLTPWEVDEFITQSNMHDYDYSIGITSEKVLSYYHPTKEKPGIQMIYFHLREDLWRQNNLHLAKPLRFAHLDYVEKMYEWRYQTHGFNVLRMMFALLQVSWRFMTALRVFVLLQLSLYYDRHGHPNLSKSIRMHAPLETFQRGVSNILGARTQLTYTHLGGAALDIDHAENLDAMDAMYDEWMAHQHSLRNRPNH